MAGRGGAGHGISGAAMARGYFLPLPLPMPSLLLLVGLLLPLNSVHALTIRHHPALTLDTNSFKFRGTRSAFMQPTAIVLSPPNESHHQQPQQTVRHAGSSSSSSSFLPPGVVSRAPATHDHLDTYPQGLATPAVTPPPDTFNPRLDGPTANRSQSWASRTFTGGWAGMTRPTGYTRRMPNLRLPQPRPLDTSPSRFWPVERDDTYGYQLSEDFSHYNTPGGRRQNVFAEKSSGDRRGTLFNSEFHHEQVNEGRQNRFDFDVTSDYQPEDYNSNHEYDNDNILPPSDQIPSPEQDPRTFTFQEVIEILNLRSHAELHNLLDHRGVTPTELRDFLNSGAEKRDVLEFLGTPTASTTIMTTPNPPVLSHPPKGHDVLVVEDNYEDDVTRESDSDSTQRDKKQSRRNRKRGKGDKDKKNRNRSKRRRIKNKHRENTSSEDAILVSENTPTLTAVPDPWVPNTPRTFIDTTTTTITTSGDIIPSTTQPKMPKTTSVEGSDVAIVSMTMVEAPSDPQPDTPGHTTFLEGVSPPKKANTHDGRITEEKGNTRMTFRARPSEEPEKTMNEIERVNFVREKQRDDYVFPLRGLLIISGLMGAMAVFTLVVLISYALVKCTKKPVVNNYQVSKLQKTEGT